MRQSALAIGETAAAILLEEISAGDKRGRTRHVKLMPELIVRTSTTGRGLSPETP